MAESEDDLAGLPIVVDATRAQSENIQTVLDRMQKGRVVIPDYQRDADQWDRRKQSLFVESLQSNLTERSRLSMGNSALRLSVNTRQVCLQLATTKK